MTTKVFAPSMEKLKLAGVESDGSLRNSMSGVTSSASTYMREAAVCYDKLAKKAKHPADAKKFKFMKRKLLRAAEALEGNQ
jgi:hypothetical protein